MEQKLADIELEINDCFVDKQKVSQRLVRKACWIDANHCFGQVQLVPLKKYLEFCADGKNSEGSRLVMMNEVLSYTWSMMKAITYLKNGKYFAMRNELITHSIEAMKMRIEAYNSQCSSVSFHMADFFGSHLHTQ